MLLVPTILSESKIHGIGVFAAREIKTGQPVWRFDSRCDFRRDDFPDWLEKFVFRDSAGSALDGDSARFMNHADSPNLIAAAGGLVAAFYILSGDELTVDYNSPESLCELGPAQSNAKFAMIEQAILDFWSKDDEAFRRSIHMDGCDREISAHQLAKFIREKVRP